MGLKPTIAATIERKRLRKQECIESGQHSSPPSRKKAEEVLGRKEKSHKPWISYNSWATIDDRKKLKQKIEVTKSERIKDQLRKDYKEKDKETKRSIRRDKRKWIDDLIREAEEAANKGQMKTIYDITKIVCNCKSRQSQAVRDKNQRMPN